MRRTILTVLALILMLSSTAQAKDQIFPQGKTAVTLSTQKSGSSSCYFNYDERSDKAIVVYIIRYASGIEYVETTWLRYGEILGNFAAQIHGSRGSQILEDTKSLGFYANCIERYRAADLPKPRIKNMFLKTMTGL